MTSFTWNAADYAQQSSAQKAWAAELLAKLRLQAHEHVLDLGCGDGLVTAAIAAQVPQGRAVGMDYSAGMVAHALTVNRAAGTPNLHYLQGDARALPFAEAFDAVFSNAVLHWVKDHRPVLAGLRRSLRPGGRVLLQMGGQGNGVGVRQAADELLQSEAWRRYFAGFEFPYAFYGPEEYGRWLPQAGLQALRVALIPKDMTHANRAGLAGWIRTTWLPYTSRLPEAAREQFVTELTARYLQKFPADADGQTHVAMVRLEVEAVRR